MAVLNARSIRYGCQIQSHMGRVKRVLRTLNPGDRASTSCVRRRARGRGGSQPDDAGAHDDVLRLLDNRSSSDALAGSRSISLAMNRAFGSRRRSPLALKEIVQAGLCISAGCARASPDHAGDDDRDDRGPSAPSRPPAARSRDGAADQHVCPGVRVDSADPRLVPAGATEIDRLWGPAARLVIAHATDPELRHLGASELIKSRQLLIALARARSATCGCFAIAGTAIRARPTSKTDRRRGARADLRREWDDEDTWRLQARCKICPDALGEGADLVAADCWEGGCAGGRGRGLQRDPGAHAARRGAVRRSRAGRGVLTVTREIGFRDMIASSPIRWSKEAAVWPRLIGMRAAGRPVLRIAGLQLRSLALSRRSPGRASRARRTRPTGASRAGRLSERAAGAGARLGAGRSLPG